MLSAGVDLALPLRGNRLVGGQGIDGEESRRVAGQAVGGDHADPAVEGILLPGRLSRLQVIAQRYQLCLGLRMIEHRKIDIRRRFPLMRNFPQTLRQISHLRNAQTPGGEDLAEGIDIVGDHFPAQQCRFDDAGASPAEGIVDRVARPGEQFDKKTR